MRGGLANATRSRAITEALPLIRPCGATFPLGGRQSGAAGPGMPRPNRAINKTNAMRMLERAKVAYTSHEYPHEEGQAVDGANVARLTGQDPARVFKTLVTQGADRNYYVFVVPVLAELDLKKAAKAAGVKSVAMIHVADINKVTGYIRGGCSPVGMKKQFVTVYDESCLAQQTMLVSGGRIGTQIECAPADLIKVTRGRTAAITQEHEA